MERADGGNLECFLENNFEDLDWSDKIQLAKGISEGLKCLHDHQILHRDLVSSLHKDSVYRKLFTTSVLFN